MNKCKWHDDFGNVCMASYVTKHMPIGKEKKKFTKAFCYKS